MGKSADRGVAFRRRVLRHRRARGVVDRPARGQRRPTVRGHRRSQRRRRRVDRTHRRRRQRRRRGAKASPRSAGVLPAAGGKPALGPLGRSAGAFKIGPGGGFQPGGQRTRWDIEGSFVRTIFRAPPGLLFQRQPDEAPWFGAPIFPPRSVKKQRACCPFPAPAYAWKNASPIDLTQRAQRRFSAFASRSHRHSHKQA